MRLSFASLRGLTFSNPPKNRIVILYSDDYWLRTLVLRDLPATTLEVSAARVYLTAVLIARTIYRLWRLPCRRSGGGPGIKGTLRYLYTQYTLACLDQTEAEIVLTAVDNSGFFQRLSRIDRTRAYFAIQNGTRTLACVRDSLPAPPDPASIISMTNLFCFGQRDVDLYRKHGHVVDVCAPVGSLIGGYYKSRVSGAAPPPQFDLCLISQWHEHFFVDILADDFPAQVARRVGEGINRLIAFVVRLLQETGLTLVICPRNDDDRAEVAFYRDRFGENARIAHSERKAFSTYRVVEQSRLVIALNSTTLAEVFSWGHKVLWCNVPEDDHYEMPEAGISYFHGDDFDEFKSRVMTLLDMPNEEYQRSTRDSARYINHYDGANPPHEVIRSALLRQLARTHA